MHQPETTPTNTPPAASRANLNPHEPTLGKFLRGRERELDGRWYVRLRTGQILRVETLERWRRQGHRGKD